MKNPKNCDAWKVKSHGKNINIDLYENVNDENPRAHLSLSLLDALKFNEGLSIALGAVQKTYY